MMRTQSEGYGNPLSTAQPILKGRVVGAHAQTRRAIDPEAADWHEVDHGESRVVPGGTLLQVQSTAGQLQSFWFEEDGRIYGPMTVATSVGHGLKARFQQPDPDVKRARLHFASVLTICLAAVLLLVWNELRFWSPEAARELMVTLGVAWLVLMVIGFRSFQPIRRRLPGSIEITPRRPQLK